MSNANPIGNLPNPQLINLFHKLLEHHTQQIMQQKNNNETKKIETNSSNSVNNKDQDQIQHTSPDITLHLNAKKQRLENHQQSDPVTMQQNNFGNTENITLKFKSKTNFGQEFRNYIKLHSEIRKCKPTANILNAYTDPQNQLIIKVKNNENANIIRADWPNDAVKSGISLINTPRRFHIALLNVDINIDNSEEEFRKYMKD